MKDGDDFTLFYLEKIITAVELLEREVKELGELSGKNKWQQNRMKLIELEARGLRRVLAKRGIYPSTEKRENED